MPRWFITTHEGWLGRKSNRRVYWEALNERWLELTDFATSYGTKEEAESTALFLAGERPDLIGHLEIGRVGIEWEKGY